VVKIRSRFGSGKDDLPMLCLHCGEGPVRAIRGVERVVIRCEGCGARLFAYYLDPRRQQEGDQPPAHEDLFLIKLVERDLLGEVSPITRALYAVIQRYIQNMGYAPTLREMGQVLGWPSIGTVSYHLKALEDIGLIERDYGAARGIRMKWSA
jgi:hypothetical protein